MSATRRFSFEREGIEIARQVSPETLAGRPAVSLGTTLADEGTPT